MHQPRAPRLPSRRAFGPRLRRLVPPTLLVLALLAVVGCYVPFHRLQDVEPDYKRIGDWSVKAYLASVPYSKDAYVEVRAWYAGADTTRLPLRDELLLVDRFEIAYEAEKVVQRASPARCRCEYRYEQPGVAAYDVDLFPERRGRLLTTVWRHNPAGLDRASVPSSHDAFLMPAPFHACEPVATFMQDVEMAWQAYWVRDLDPDTLRVEPWRMPAPQRFVEFWESGDIREPGRNGPIRIAFRVRIFDLPSCAILHEEEIVDYKERRTEWDWYMGN